MNYFTYLMPIEALNDIYAEVRAFSPSLVRDEFESLEAAWRAVCSVLYTVWDEGFLVLEERLNIGELERIGAPNCKFFSEILLYCADAHDVAILLDMMVNDYYVNRYEDVDKAVLFLYMVCILECSARNERYEMQYSAEEYVKRNLLLFSEGCRRKLIGGDRGVTYANFMTGDATGAVFAAEDDTKTDSAAGDDTGTVFAWEGLLRLHESGRRGAQSGASAEDDVDGWDPVLKIGERDIRKVWEYKKEMLCALTDQVIEESIFQICNALCRVDELANRAFNQGLAAMEDMARQAEQHGNEIDLFFSEALRRACDGDLDVRYRMMEKYVNLARDPGQDFQRILYLEAVHMVFLGINPHLINEICIGMLPVGKRAMCHRIVEKRKESRASKRNNRK